MLDLVDLVVETQISNIVWLALEFRVSTFYQTLFNKMNDPPCSLQTVGTDAGWSEMLQKMGVSGDGEGVSFERFWSLIQSQATQQYGLSSLDKVSKCSCIVL